MYLKKTLKKDKEKLNKFKSCIDYILVNILFFRVITQHMYYINKHNQRSPVIFDKIRQCHSP